MSSTINDILKLGDPRLYEVCPPILESEIHLVKEWTQKLHNAMMDIRRVYDFGRGIAAPQLGIMKRLVYVHIDQPLILINPTILNPSEERFVLWDDCMSFPNLLVQVSRHKSLTLKYRDQNWREQEIRAVDGMSELIQHEVDHLDGILCTMRALDNQSFKWHTKAE